MGFYSGVINEGDEIKYIFLRDVGSQQEEFFEESISLLLFRGDICTHNGIRYVCHLIHPKL